MNVEIILKYLTGSWLIKKNISNIGIFIGEACFTKINNQTLIYKEEMRLLRENQMKSFAVHNYYVKNNELYMQFMNQNKSFKLDINNNSAYGKYNCGKDIYATTINFLDVNSFSSIYEVSGGKNYIIITDFKKI